MTEYDDLSKAFKELTGDSPNEIKPLVQHASERRIFRLTSSAARSIIGVINPNIRENEIFVAFARYFRLRGLAVPEIYHYQPGTAIYLEEDLGDETLLDLLTAERKRCPGEPFPDVAYQIYCRALEALPRFQIESAKGFDFSRCYPERDLLPGTFAGDCAAFSTELVKRLLPNFDISLLTRDFAALIELLERADATFFVYRDFQSRNIMHHQGKPYFIDFQSGRRGPLQYDVVSLLYQSSAQIPDEVRAKLLNHYLSAAAQYAPINIEDFHRYFGGFIVARMLQVLGVYGRQGLGAKKSYFTKSIPAALDTLALQLNQDSFPLNLSALGGCVSELRMINLEA